MHGFYLTCRVLLPHIYREHTTHYASMHIYIPLSHVTSSQSTERFGPPSLLKHSCNTAIFLKCTRPLVAQESYIYLTLHLPSYCVCLMNTVSHQFLCGFKHYYITGVSSCIPVDLCFFHSHCCCYNRCLLLICTSLGGCSNDKMRFINVIHYYLLLRSLIVY